MSEHNKLLRNEYMTQASATVDAESILDKSQIVQADSKNLPVPIKIAFIQNISEYLFGYMYLSAALKNAGHTVELFIGSLERDISDRLNKFSPDIVGFSCVSGQENWGIQILQDYKKVNPGCLTIMGGPHTTYVTEVINNDGVDAICIGEGDIAIVEIANSFSRVVSEGIYVENIWHKLNGTILKNPLGRLIEDLDSLPFPDHEIYRKYKQFQENKNIPLFVTRGCPFKCSYCYMNAMRVKFSGLGTFVRSRSPENIIEEIKILSEKYELKFVSFWDSTLNFNHKWFVNVMDHYSQYKDRVPFFCHIRPDLVRDGQIESLAKAGCSILDFGIEAGSIRLRKNILKRSMTDKQIVDVSNKLKKNNIKFCTGNIFGLPTETLDETYSLIKLNQKIQPDVVYSTVFQPYPGTEITEFAIEKGLVEPNEYNSNYYLRSPLRQADIRIQERLHKMCWYFVRFPRLTPLFDFMAKKLPFKILIFLFLVSLGLQVRVLYGYSWFGISVMPLTILGGTPSIIPRFLMVTSQTKL
jgi:anaerobic magnesium-protoporphyrin IX monomethyl ester cyclase